MICQQCGQGVMLDPLSQHMPPWCQRCGADIRDALCGTRATQLPPTGARSPLLDDYRPVVTGSAGPSHEPRRPTARPLADRDAGAKPDGVSYAAVFVGVALFTAAAAILAWKLTG